MIANTGASTTVSSTSGNIVISAGSADSTGCTGSTSRGWNDGSWQETNYFKICLDSSTRKILQKRYTCSEPHNLPM